MTSENLKHYLTIWNLSNPTLIAESVRSDVYTVTDAGGTTVILKLLTPVGDEERIGAVALRHFDGQGAVFLMRHDDHAQLMEYADGEDLVRLVERGNDESATLILAEVANKLHAVPIDSPPPELMSLQRRYRSLFQKAEQHRQHLSSRDSIFIRAAEH
ncbi:MAG TPA: aminoglycoside phosphotransferase family protein, partial [Aggregatilineales bacterium]|nr:aminoglycoside phosphotransferase family protein [Aggregatilineales bacterium]